MLPTRGNAMMRNRKYVQEKPPFSIARSIPFFQPKFSMVGTKFYFSIIQPCQERTQKNSQIMLNSLMLVLDDVLFVVFLLGPKPFQSKSLLFRLRVREAKQLLVI